MAEWIMPYNEKRIKFRMNDALRELGKVEQEQNKNVKNMEIGDIVYLYQASPVKAIRWKCRVTDVEREKSIIDDSAYSDSGEVYKGPFIELVPLYEYLMYQPLSFEKFRDYGYGGHMQGAFRPGTELLKYIHKIDKTLCYDGESVRINQKISISDLKKLAEQDAERNPEIKGTKTKRYRRSPYISAYVKAQAKGCCELCGKNAPFLDKDGIPYLETHHVKWLSHGGADSIDNTTALCPNCHRKMHFLQDAGDISRLKSVLKNR